MARALSDQGFTDGPHLEPAAGSKACRDKADVRPFRTERSFMALLES